MAAQLAARCAAHAPRVVLLLPCRRYAHWQRVGQLPCSRLATGLLHSTQALRNIS